MSGPSVDVTVRRVVDPMEAAQIVRRLKVGDAVEPTLDRTVHLLVAEVAGEPAGYTVAYELPRIDRATAMLFVYEVEVAPAHRRRGIGAALMGHLLDGRLDKAFVLTDPDNHAANALYRHLGARSVDQRLWGWDAPC